MIKKMTFPLALVVAAAFSAHPALAQHGNGHGHGNGGEHGHGNGRGDEVRAERRDRDDDNGDRFENRRVRDDDRRIREEERIRAEQIRRDQERFSRRSSRSTRFERRVPPGWCIGRGNPHNTVANCGAGSNRYDRRYDPRYNGTYGTYNGRNSNNYPYGTYNGYGTSNRQAYADWKRVHDRQCADLARQRPLDLRWQLQVRNQCSAEDRAMRQRYGI